ncbi:hypothetical protein SKAU_G00161990 [Synaphobranchus kaupii]|uniref:Uncharacterized protein n=1 Tax=Synaphobranchus kaupii TaxID=118154 RepID=A0A9Q1FIP3_SYNKA|nr:hypothetical protein SKAU_G00161990 [Synaphobranchus kaupii]
MGRQRAAFRGASWMREGVGGEGCQCGRVRGGEYPAETPSRSSPRIPAHSTGSGALCEKTIPGADRPPGRTDVISDLRLDRCQDLMSCQV